MALADPQSVTLSGVATPLPRTSSGDNQSTYTSNDGMVRLIVSHSRSKNGRFRRTVRIEHRKVAADPFSSTAYAQYSMTAYAVFDVPSVGYTVAQQKDIWDGFITQLQATSGAFVTKVLGGEN